MRRSVMCYHFLWFLLFLHYSVSSSSSSSEDEMDRSVPIHPTNTDSPPNKEENVCPSLSSHEDEEYYNVNHPWTEPLTELDLYEKFNCDDVFQSERPIHTTDTWMLLRGVYVGIVGPIKASIMPLSDKSGISVPFEVRPSPGKGRGVYATSLIPKHTHVWNGKMNSAAFKSGWSYRKFLMSLPNDLACDVLQWAYVSEFNDELTIWADLDEGSFMNHGGKDMESNVGCDTEMVHQYVGGCQEHSFALRDIQEGEELLVNYDHFDVEDGFEKFGL